MASINLAVRLMRRLGSIIAALSCAWLVACSGGGEMTPAAMRPIPKEAMHLLAKQGMTASSPILIRVFKEESELEVWKQREDGRYHHFKTYPVCNWSGDLGPKLRQGDKQAPEGFYTVSNGQMNPKSQFHLAFNVGFPNAFDRAHGRTGAHLMVHGDCRSAGCYAMTDALVEEIYALAREALNAGQRDFQVHAFPFRMTDANMKRHARSQWMPFWRTLKPGYDDFEATRKPLEVAVCERRYLVNVRFDGNQGPAAPDAVCPPYSRIKPDLFVAAPEQQKLAQSRVVVPGKKVRNLVAEAETGRGDPNSQPARRTFSFKGWALGGPVKPIQSFGFSQ